MVSLNSRLESNKEEEDDVAGHMLRLSKRCGIFAQRRASAERHQSTLGAESRLLQLSLELIARFKIMVDVWSDVLVSVMSCSSSLLLSSLELSDTKVYEP